MKCPEQANSERQKADYCLLGEIRQQLLKGTGFLWRMMEMFCNQRVVTVAQPCEYTKNHWIIHSKWVNCMASELCLIMFKQNSSNILNCLSCLNKNSSLCTDQSSVQVHSYPFTALPPSVGFFTWQQRWRLVAPSWAFTTSFPSSGCHNKTQWTGWLKHKNLFLMVLEVGKSKRKVSTRFSSK